MGEYVLTGTNRPSIKLSSVISLDIQLGAGFAGDVANFRSLDFPAVETLTIHGHSHDMIEALTEHRCLYPAVTSLTAEFKYFVGGHYVPAAMILDFISLPNVREVAFLQTPFPYSSIYDLLHCHLPGHGLGLGQSQAKTSLAQSECLNVILSLRPSQPLSHIRFLSV